MYKIHQHCQICGTVKTIEVDDEVFKGGVDADWHCGSPMVWNDDLSDPDNADIDHVEK